MGVLKKIKNSRGILYKKLMEKRVSKRAGAKPEKKAPAERPEGQKIRQISSDELKMMLMEGFKSTGTAFNNALEKLDQLKGFGVGPAGGPRTLEDVIKTLQGSSRFIGKYKTDLMESANYNIKKAEDALRLQQVLILVTEQKEITPAEIADKLDISVNTASDLIKRLVSVGHLRKNRQTTYLLKK